MASRVGVLASAVALLGAGGLRLGPFRLTAYGACAAAGVVSAIWLSTRAAERSAITAEAVWDVGLFAMLSCFVVSRLLLVLADPAAFTRYPLTVLGLPSLTFGGMVLAGVAVWVYLRQERLPLLRILDVFAPGGAVLAAFLELGHGLDGSEMGMPIRTSWTSHSRGDVLTLHPVALYGLVGSLLLAVGLWRAMRVMPTPGHTAAMGLAVGGLFAFGLDLITAPSELFGRLALEPGQIVALAMLSAGTLMWVLVPARPPGLRETNSVEAARPTQAEVR